MKRKCVLCGHFYSEEDLKVLVDKDIVEIHQLRCRNTDDDPECCKSITTEEGICPSCRAES